jgi:hypothetical protein
MIFLLKYPYFDVVVGFAWSHSSESYAGDRVAAGKASLARRVKGDDPDKRARWSCTLWVGRGAANPPQRKYVLLRSF